MKIENNEVSYGLTGDRSRGRVCSYHGKPSPRDYKKGGKKDIQGLPKKVQAVFTDDESKYTIGFEVEKNSLHRNSVKEYELFCGFEEDGSCGYEAVTNILPLLPASKWRMKVFDMMYKAERIIDDKYSPSNAKCGGHITVAVEGMYGEHLLAKMRPYAGLLYAVWHTRIKNTYCMYNPTLLSEDNQDNWIKVNYDRWHHKYRVALPKYNALEWRLPTRFTSVKQMMRRYELFYEVVDASVNGSGDIKSFKSLIRKVKPILSSLYDGDNDKVNARCEMALAFREYIITNGRTVSPIIRDWVTPNRDNNNDN